MQPKPAALLIIDEDGKYGFGAAGRATKNLRVNSEQGPASTKVANPSRSNAEERTNLFLSMRP